MAVRLVNLHHQALRVELRGGGALMLAPGARSDALPEELLYDNTHVADWERSGWLRRVPATMGDVAADAAARAKAEAARPAAGASAAKGLGHGPVPRKTRSPAPRAARPTARKAGKR